MGRSKKFEENYARDKRREEAKNNLFAHREQAQKNTGVLNDRLKKEIEKINSLDNKLCNSKMSVEISGNGTGFGG